MYDVFKKQNRVKNRIPVLILSIFSFVLCIFSLLLSLGIIKTPDRYTTDIVDEYYADVVKNEEFRYMSADGQDFSPILQAQFILAAQKGRESFVWLGANYGVVQEGEDLYRVTNADGSDLGIAFKDTVKPSVEPTTFSYSFTLEALRAFANGTGSFTVDGVEYTLDEGSGVSKDEEDVAFISRYIVNPIYTDVFLSRQFQEELVFEIEKNATKFTFTDADGVESEYKIEFRENHWFIKKGTTVQKQVENNNSEDLPFLGMLPLIAIIIFTLYIIALHKKQTSRILLLVVYGCIGLFVAIEGVFSVLSYKGILNLVCSMLCLTGAAIGAFAAIKGFGKKIVVLSSSALILVACICWNINDIITAGIVSSSLFRHAAVLIFTFALLIFGLSNTLPEMEPKAKQSALASSGEIKNVTLPEGAYMPSATAAPELELRWLEEDYKAKKITEEEYRSRRAAIIRRL